MAVTFTQSIVALLLGIVLIVVLTTKYNVHAFFALVLACVVVGLGLSLPLSEVLATTKTGFGNIIGALGLDHTMGKVFTVLAMGAGSMMVSHANDSYFWVISRFSGVGMNVMLRVYTIATLVMGLVAIGVIYLLYVVLG